MKIAVIYNRDSKSVINLFGMPNREKIGMKTIRRLTNALRNGGHDVIALEGDKDLIDRLEDFMPRVVHGERPGMVFNVSYGLQGQARYTHIPSILEMVGIPYVASGVTVRSRCGLDLLRVCPLCQPSNRRSVPLPPPSDWGQRAEMKPVQSER